MWRWLMSRVGSINRLIGYLLGPTKQLIDWTGQAINCMLAWHANQTIVRAMTELIMFHVTLFMYYLIAANMPRPCVSKDGEKTHPELH